MRHELTFTKRYYFVFVAFNIVVTIPTIFFIFKETNQKSLEEIDLLFGDRALGTLPEHLEEKDMEAAIRRESIANEKGVEVNQIDLAVKPEQTK